MRTRVTIVRNRCADILLRSLKPPRARAAPKVSESARNCATKPSCTYVMSGYGVQKAIKRNDSHRKKKERSQCRDVEKHIWRSSVRMREVIPEKVPQVPRGGFRGGPRGWRGGRESHAVRLRTIYSSVIDNLYLCSIYT